MQTTIFQALFPMVLARIFVVQLIPAKTEREPSYRAMLCNL